MQIHFIAGSLVPFRNDGVTTCLDFNLGNVCVATEYACGSCRKKVKSSCGQEYFKKINVLMDKQLSNEVKDLPNGTTNTSAAKLFRVNVGKKHQNFRKL